MDDVQVRRLRAALKTIQRRLRREVLSDSGLSRSALQVVVALARAGHATPSHLATELRMAGPNVAAALRELDTAGHIHREPDPDDRRRTRITVTADGRRAVDEIREERDTWLARAITAQLDHDEQQLLAQAAVLLERVAAHHDERETR